MRYFADFALLPDGFSRDVVLEVVDGRFTEVTTGSSPGDAHRLPGVVLPGLANAHSHAFHRALRARVPGGGSFWSWREAMYAVASRLDPESYLKLARATYAEMALAGVTTVGEFHYLHHAPDGARYDDPNVMAEALRQAAEDAGVRLTLLDCCYLAGGLESGGHLPLSGPQVRFGDGDVSRWAERVEHLTPSSGMAVGVAAHSVRAVPRTALDSVSFVAAGRPLHVHLSEQPAENEACQAFYGCSPTTLLDDEGVLGPATTAVHATHLADDDIGHLGRTRTTVCLCPTTERDLADGIGLAGDLRDAGCRLTVGSDQHVVIDLFEEARGVEMHDRLRTLQRERFTTGALLEMLTGHASLGWPDTGRLEVGAVADLVAVRLDTVRTAGASPDEVVLAASAADVDTVVVAGRTIVEAGEHRLGGVAGLLTAAIDPLWEDV